MSELLAHLAVELLVLAAWLAGAGGVAYGAFFLWHCWETRRRSVAAAARMDAELASVRRSRLVAEWTERDEPVPCYLDAGRTPGENGTKEAVEPPS